MTEMVDLGLVPVSLLNYQNPFITTFDIETLSQNVDIRRTEFLTIESHLYVVSIAVSSNLPGTTDQFFCRKSSSTSDGQAMIIEFMDYLETLQQKQLELLPDEITLAMKKLSQSWQRLTSGIQEAWTHSKKHKLFQRINYLKKFFLLSVYGFNSGKSHLINGHIIFN